MHKKPIGNQSIHSPQAIMKYPAPIRNTYFTANDYAEACKRCHDKRIKHDHGKIKPKASAEKKESCSVPNANVRLKNGKYLARIVVKGKQIHLGSFDNLCDAIAARRLAEKKYGLVA